MTYVDDYDSWTPTRMNNWSNPVGRLNTASEGEATIKTVFVDYMKNSKTLPNSR